MLITNKKSIRNVDNFLKGFEAGDLVQIVLTDIDSFKNKLILMGFSSDLPIGEKLLPPVFGRVSNYNANGEYELLKDLPKEKFYITQIREIKDWHGNNHTVFPSIEYQRYQRRLINVPSQEICILQDTNNEKVICSERIELNNESKEKIKHIINLFLELFGECNIVDNEFLTRVRTKINRVNWNILPQGEIPWQIAKIKIIELLEKTNIESREDTLDRFEYISRFNPDFMAIGNGGFSDYVVFGFKEKNLYVLENSFAGNATYIFRDDWKTISQLTKAEILKENLQAYRLIHKRNWKRQIKEILIQETI